VRAKGVAYDTGFIRDGKISREACDPQVVRRELAIIRDDLHCNAVQVIGGDPGRLELAGRLAAELGLEVWFSPYPLELAPGQILPLLADCAGRAERLRAGGAAVVFVTGVELSIMNRGFLFALDGFPHRPGGDPRYDLDMASPAIVKFTAGRRGGAYPDMAWEPKAAFTAVAECYRGSPR
jgi:hypothetical protein